MEFDIFFSICQTPVDGELPDEATMFINFFEQLQLADELGFGVAWVAQAHLSTAVQKMNSKPVVPHWEGEVGLCTDFFQLAHQMFAKTNRIEVGSAVMSILANGGPIAVAERVGLFCALHGIDPQEQRRIHIGFSAGRFEFMARPYGIVPRDGVEEVAWPALRGQIFAEASEIFLRLVRGDVLKSDDIRETVLTRENFRSDEDWEAVQKAALNERGLRTEPDEVPIESRYSFEEIKVVPQHWRRELLNLVVGSHDPRLQKEINRILPVQVFNLSITPPELIEKTHSRMESIYHPDGGDWERSMMPRTVLIFINEEEGLTPAERISAAQKEAKIANAAYWRALQGTIDPQKIQEATDNAVVGDAQEVARLIKERFHPEDRLMCWFDFFNHDSARICRNMRAFHELVLPLTESAPQGGFSE